jgi:cation:H+ antiporter
LGAVLIFLLGGDLLIQGYGRDEIGFVDGVVLLLFFVIFMVYSFALNKTEKKEENDYGIKIISYSRSALYIVGGITGLVLAGNFIVDSAVELGLKAGLSQNLLGLTVVAAGTSLPEIITAIAAARKKQIDMVIGGIVGTVVFNAFFALGVTATVSNLPFSSDSIFDVLFLVVISIMFFFFMFVGKRNILEKWQGYLFVLLYVIYISYVVFRG